jgi:endonuclease YncB( thermonuclease family)
VLFLYLLGLLCSSVNEARKFLQNLYSSVRFRSPPPNNPHTVNTLQWTTTQLLIRQLPYVRRTRNIATPILFQGRVVGVQDGDTITVLDSSNANHRIRLQGIDAPEKGQAFGTRSHQNLSQLAFDRFVTIEWSKHDRYPRIVGKVTLDGRDVCLEGSG